MARQKTCDSCGSLITEENPIAAKLYFSPIQSGQKVREAYSRYSAHMDIGKCCIVKVHQLGKWQQRKSAKTKQPIHAGEGVL